MKSLQKPRAVVIGGSLGGLLSANTLRAAGRDVDVFETSPNQLESRGGGPTFRALVESTDDPFMQPIVDLRTPKMVFGRAVLLGDARRCRVPTRRAVPRRPLRMRTHWRWRCPRHGKAASRSIQPLNVGRISNCSAAG